MFTIINNKDYNNQAQFRENLECFNYARTYTSFDLRAKLRPLKGRAVCLNYGISTQRSLPPPTVGLIRRFLSHQNLILGFQKWKTPRQTKKRPNGRFRRDRVSARLPRRSLR